MRSVTQGAPKPVLPTLSPLEGLGRKADQGRRCRVPQQGASVRPPRRPLGQSLQRGGAKILSSARPCPDAYAAPSVAPRTRPPGNRPTVARPTTDCILSDAMPCSVRIGLARRCCQPRTPGRNAVQRENAYGASRRPAPVRRVPLSIGDTPPMPDPTPSLPPANHAAMARPMSVGILSDAMPCNVRTAVERPANPHPPPGAPLDRRHPACAGLHAERAARQRPGNGPTDHQPHGLGRNAMQREDRLSAPLLPISRSRTQCHAT
jgi:hypothetical protein